MTNGLKARLRSHSLAFGLVCSLAASFVQAGDAGSVATVSGRSSLTVVEGRVRGEVTSASRRQTLVEVAALVGFDVRGAELVDEEPTSMTFDDLPPEKAIAHILRTQSYTLHSRTAATAAGTVTVLSKAAPSDGTGPSLVPEATQPIVLGTATRGDGMASGGAAGSAVGGTAVGSRSGGAMAGTGAGRDNDADGDAGTPSGASGAAADDAAPADGGVAQSKLPAAAASAVTSRTDSAAGDFDGDGTDDVVVTSEGAELTLLLGTGDGLESSRRTSLASGTTSTVETVQAGDFDGDGIDDMVAILRSETELSIATLRGGRSGFGRPRATALADILGTDGVDAAALGVTLASADLDADGYDDLVLGLPGADTGASDAGTVMLLRGGARGLRMQVEAWRPDLIGLDAHSAKDAHLGSALAAADFDGDGLDDLAVGAPGADGTANDAGQVLVFKGSVGGLERHPSRGPVGPTADAQLGRVLAAGTVNGDGRADLVAIVGAGATRKVVVFAGTDEGLSRTALAEAQPDDQPFGDRLAVADFDADGHADLAVVRPSPDGKTDELEVFTGGARGLGTGRTVRAKRGRTLARGASLVTGDFDADGFADLAVECGGAARVVGVVGGGSDGLHGWHFSRVR